MLAPEDIKKALGKYAAGLVPPNSTIGLGTGTTVYWLIKELSLRIKDGLAVKAVPTSNATRKLAADAGMILVGLNDIDSISLTIDGADEIDPQLQLIKGGGGALLQEKMVAAASRQLLIIADESKFVGQLGQFPLPVEVIPNGWKQVKKKIADLGCDRVALRLSNNLPFITDNGHYILDCDFRSITDPGALNISLHLIPGVVETGLFINMANSVILGYADGRIEIKEKTTAQ